MKLKLSTLLVIIGIIYFAYYYFIYNPCHASAPRSQPQPVLQSQPQPAPTSPGDGITVLDDSLEPVQEHFGVTVLDDYSEPESSHSISYYNSGNVRPDNVNIVEEAVTLL